MREAQMIFNSTQPEDAQRVSIYALLCSRCGLSSTKLATKHGKNELKLFLRGLFYLNALTATIIKATPAKAPIIFKPVGIFEKVKAALLPLLLLI